MGVLQVVVSRKHVVCTHLLLGPRIPPINKVQRKPRFVMAALIGFTWHGKCTMLIHLPKNVADVCPSVRNGTKSTQWCGNRWRSQDTVHKCFVNSTEVVSATRSPRSTIEITCNQVNFLRNHDGTKSEDELLGNAFLLGVDVANK